MKHKVPMHRVPIYRHATKWAGTDAVKFRTFADRRDDDRERSRSWHHKRRARGICHSCPKESTDINPRTGQPFWKCRSCRTK